MAKSTGGPFKWHIGHIGSCIQMVCNRTLPYMAHGAVHIGRGIMRACTAAIIRVYGKGIQYMAALALLLGAIIEFQAGVRACAGMT